MNDLVPIGKPERPFTLFWTLNDKNEVIPAQDVYEWGAMFEDWDRRCVANTIIANGGIRISTAFMGIDMGFNEEPVCFETMIFIYLPLVRHGEDGDVFYGLRLAGYYNEWQNRYRTWEQAEYDHKKIVRELLPLVGGFLR